MKIPVPYSIRITSSFFSASVWVFSGQGCWKGVEVKCYESIEYLIIVLSFIIDTCSHFNILKHSVTIHNNPYKERVFIYTIFYFKIEYDLFKDGKVLATFDHMVDIVLK